jgi:hypothetical protein
MHHRAELFQVLTPNKQLEILSENIEKRFVWFINIILRILGFRREYIPVSRECFVKLFFGFLILGLP